MSIILFNAMPTRDADLIWSGGHDAYDLIPELRVSAGDGTLCRHCLRNIAEGIPYLTLAYRPFPALQPYAETGPIFLHAEPCPRYAAIDVLPPVLEISRDFIVRGYGFDDRIVYGTGGVTETARIAGRAAELLTRDDIAYVHVRSARNNCFQCRIDRRKAPRHRDTGAFGEGLSLAQATLSTVSGA